MDLTFDILVPRSGIDKMSIQEIFAGWGNQKFSRDPREYKFQSSILFQEYENESYNERIIKKEIKQYNFISLALKGESLNDLEFKINLDKNYKKEDSELVSLFYEMYKVLDKFCIMLLLDDEPIDEWYVINDVEQAIDIFWKSLNWDSPKSFVISKGF